jgi:hypothetical protein
MFESDLDVPVYGARAFAKILNRSPAQIYHDLDKGLLDAKKWGGTWASTPRRLLNGPLGPDNITPREAEPQGTAA